MFYICCFLRGVVIVRTLIVFISLETGNLSLEKFLFSNFLKFSVCHEVFLPKREIRNPIVGYEEPENASYCLVMVKYGGGNTGLASVTVAALLESFVPVERNPLVSYEIYRHFCIFLDIFNDF